VIGGIRGAKADLDPLRKDSMDSNTGTDLLCLKGSEGGNSIA
jgi:hypothetical protein